MESPVPLISPPCTLCGGLAFTTVLRGARDWIWQKPGVFQLARCDGCGLVATRPRPADDALGFYYENAYSGEAEAGMRRFQTESGLGRLIARYRLAVLGRVHRLGPEDRLLDVGCSYGGFLAVARRQSGCQTAGLDLDAGSIAEAVDPEQTEYRVGLLTEAGYPDGSFTVITFLESLEHHTEPVAALRAARRALVPGGICLVEVPNFGGLWRRIFRTAWLPLLIPQHLVHFTPKTLAAAFAAAGFEPVARHQTMFYPLEGVASLWIWLARVLRMPPPGKVSWRTPFDVVLFLLMIPLYFVFEIPSQFILRWLGLAGHQIAVARAPAAPAVPLPAPAPAPGAAADPDPPPR